jgi:Zn-dependent peptidase ImmA (M78 family)
MSNPAVSRLCETWGSMSPNVAIRKAVEQTFPELSRTSPPVDVRRLAAKRGICVMAKRMPFDGTISRLRGGGYVVALNRAQSEARQRFTCAHEIGHTFFFDLQDGSVDRVEDTNLEGAGAAQEVERLCNQAATEILLPRRAFSAEARACGLAVGSLLRLSHVYAASIWCTARRLAEVWPYKVAIVLWQADARHGHYRAEWVVTSGGIKVRRPLLVTEDVPIYRTFQGPAQFRGRKWVSLGGPIDDYFVDGVRLGSTKATRVLTLFILEGRAETLVSAPARSPQQQFQEPLF